MLVSSAVRRSKSSSAVSWPVASHPVGDGGLPKASTKADAALNVQINSAAFLKGCYPHGTLGMGMNTQTQAGLVGMIHHRKAWGKAFPGLNMAGIDGAFKNNSAVRKFVLKKKKNSVTAARMQPWVKELLDVLNRHPKGEVGHPLAEPLPHLNRPPPTSLPSTTSVASLCLAQ